MSGSRLDVLGAIASGLRRGPAPPGASREHPAGAPERPAPVDRRALVSSFTGEAAALGVEIHRAVDEAAAVTEVGALLRRLGAGRVLAWDDEALGVPGLGAALRAAGVVLESCELPVEPGARAARLQELDAVPAGLTGALAGLADTGSLALASGPGRGRIASLLPPVHVALLGASQLVPTFADFLAAHPSVCDLGSNLVLVTGPSRTADIEMTLTRGVHGPGHVHVVLIDE